MQATLAALTMVREDVFFLNAWLRHYGEALGRENCYVVNHGRGEEVARLAEGCNVIGIPGDAHKNFDMKRWRMLNNFVMGLRCYYDHVLVCDVDELVAVDPKRGMTLLEYMKGQKTGQVLTPLGLEVVHRIDIEKEAIADRILGPRRYVRLAPHYSKPCIVSMGTKIARGGHFTQTDRLVVTDDLYLFHLKFCDFPAYVAAMDRRNALTQKIGKPIHKTSIGRHWFAEARGEDRAEFEAFAALPLQDSFDLAWVRDEMRQSWKPRGDTGFWEFARPDYHMQYRLPTRFDGLF